MLKRIFYYLSLGLFLSCSNNTPDSNITRVGNYKNRPRGFQAVNMPGGKIALFINNQTNFESEIQNIRYFIGDKGDYTKPFRVMLYSVDSITGRPLKSMLPDTLFANATEGNKWTTVDLTEFYIKMPKNGIFASMEWIPQKDFSTASQTDYQYITYNKQNNKNQTWYCALGIHWYQLPNSDFNTMISIDLKQKAD